MLSWSTIKELFSGIGVPATVIIIVMTFYQLGWVPFPTEASRGFKAAIVAAETAEAHGKLLDTAIFQHRSHMLQSERQLDDLLNALREICFNTARSESRQRSCSELSSKYREIP